MSDPTVGVYMAEPIADIIAVRFTTFLSVLIGPTKSLNKVKKFADEH